MKLSLIVALMVMCGTLTADPVLHKFSLWATGDRTQKLHLYWGWTNGFLQGRGEGADELDACLSKMDADQALAMVDKYYRDHPERWSRPIGDELLAALTVEGGPCEGKNVWARVK